MNIYEAMTLNYRCDAKKAKRWSTFRRLTFTINTELIQYFPIIFFNTNLFTIFISNYPSIEKAFMQSIRVLVYFTEYLNILACLTTFQTIYLSKIFILHGISQQIGGYFRFKQSEWHIKLFCCNMLYINYMSKLKCKTEHDKNK